MAPRLASSRWSAAVLLALIALATMVGAASCYEARTDPDGISPFRRGLMQLTVIPGHVELRCGERADLVLRVDRQAGGADAAIEGDIFVRHDRLPLGASMENRVLGDLENEATTAMVTSPSCDVGDYDVELIARDGAGNENIAILALALRPSAQADGGP